MKYFIFHLKRSIGDVTTFARFSQEEAIAILRLTNKEYQRYTNRSVFRRGYRSPFSFKVLAKDSETQRALSIHTIDEEITEAQYETYRLFGLPEMCIEEEITGLRFVLYTTNKFIEKVIGQNKKYWEDRNQRSPWNLEIT